MKSYKEFVNEAAQEYDTLDPKKISNTMKKAIAYIKKNYKIISVDKNGVFNYYIAGREKDAYKTSFKLVISQDMAGAEYYLYTVQGNSMSKTMARNKSQLERNLEEYNVLKK